MPDAEQQELLLAFVEEGNELLDESEPLIIALESSASEPGGMDHEVLNTIFRLFHSFKGGAGFLQLHAVGKVTHEAETLLDLFRKGKGRVCGEHVDLLNQTCDFLRKLLANIGKTFTDEGFDEEADAIIARLRQNIDAIAAQERVPAGGPGKPEEAPKVENPSRQKNSEGGDSSLDLHITPEMVKQFTAESEDLLVAAEEAFLILDKDPLNTEQMDEAFRALHSFKGNAGFLGYRDLERISHQAETILDKIRQDEVRGNSELFSLLLDILDFLREGLRQIAEGKEPEIAGADGLVHLMQDALKKLAPGASGRCESAGKAEDNTAGKPDEQATERPVPDERQAREAHETVKGESATTPTSGDKQMPSPVWLATAPAVQRQSIRVDVEKLEILLDLVGELVIAEAMVEHNPDLQDLDVPLDGFEKSLLHLNKITRDLQDISTSIRMVPLASTFRRMIRLVRDLGQKTGKKVELELIGEDTEVDKTVIEKISDPLVHIVRNAMDHGIGTPKSRKEVHKPETGRLILEAKYVGGEVWISVKDDGMGLNREKILRKAVEKGLIKEEDGSELPNEEVWQLIFQPGFSTADAITDVSGRGVGMDVVRRNIENIRGKVDVNSTPGMGTEVILKIPLTLAIIDGMIIRVGKNKYIIPILTIKETLRINERNVTRTMDGTELVKIREHLYPVIRLHEFYRVEPVHTELSEGIIVVVENSGKEFCLFVDELIGQQQCVIKGLSDYVGHLKAISGCTILGDGTVCLILDIGGLAEIAECNAVPAPEAAVAAELAMMDA